jgi:hypothetical protein
MNLNAVIELMPSFHGSHVWMVELSDYHGEVSAKYGDKGSAWRLSERELAALPAEVRLGRFPDNVPCRLGLDGITVRFSIATMLPVKKSRFGVRHTTIVPNTLRCSTGAGVGSTSIRATTIVLCSSSYTHTFATGEFLFSERHVG